MKTFRAAQFAASYVRHNCNGVRALRALGHKGSPEVLRTTAWRMLTNVDVQTALAELRKRMHMDALEVVARMAEQARGDYINDFFDKDMNLDLKQARRRGKLHLLKGLRLEERKSTSSLTGEIKLETVVKNVTFESGQAALRTIMQYHGLLSDLFEIRRLPKDPAELRQFIKERLPILFENSNDPRKAG